MELHELSKIIILFCLCSALLEWWVQCGLIFENSLLTPNLITLNSTVEHNLPLKRPLVERCYDDILGTLLTAFKRC